MCPSFPVSFTPKSGAAIVRVYTAGNGVSNRSAPSRKNGRFSLKKSANVLLMSSCCESASTCEKSGLIAALNVRFGVTPHFAVRPGSVLNEPFASGEPRFGRASVRCEVTVGESSTLRPGVMPRKPVSFDIWQT